MAGTINLSLSQQLDSLGKPLSAGLLYLIQAGTTSTPQNGYQDSALTLALPNPIVLDSAGRIPQFFLADGSIKIRLTDSHGVNILTADGILVVGASSGGGGGSPVDATTLFATGDLKSRYGTGVLTGFVRANGRTIGSATSSATERANADAQSLFEYLWAADANLAVSTGRGVSANADWVANKNLTLPDWRGRVVAGLDDMGNSAAGRLTGSYFGAGATTLGVTGGTESQTLTLAQIPTGIISAQNSIGVSVNSASTVPQNVAANVAVASGVGGVAFPSTPGNGTINSTGSINVSATSNNTSGLPHPIVQPTMLATIYVKL